MISTGNFKKGKAPVFTTHNVGIMKAAERLRKASAASQSSANMILTEAAAAEVAMKSAVLPPPPPGDMEVKSRTESSSEKKPEGVKHGSKKKSK